MVQNIGSAGKLDDVLDPTQHLGMYEQLIDRVLGRLDRVVADRSADE